MAPAKPPLVEELRVPKRRVAVEVVLPSGVARRVSVFLAEAAPDHEGAERVSDLLNGGADFFPAYDEQCGAMTFLNRESVALARVARELEQDASDDIAVPTEHEVEITLVDGTRLQGVVSYLLPPERSRLGDFLNQSAPFFRLVERDFVTLVRRAQVARVALLSR
jgi:hypothetical protein